LSYKPDRIEGQGRKKKDKDKRKNNKKQKKRMKKKGDLCLYTEETKNINRTTITLLHRRQHCRCESQASPTPSAGMLPPIFLLLHFTLPPLFCKVESGE